jgi:hypothetical protein
MRVPLASATYNIVVRGDSQESTIKATVRWLGMLRGELIPPDECSTTHTWETALEQAVKREVERRPGSP